MEVKERVTRRRNEDKGIALKLQDKCKTRVEEIVYKKDVLQRIDMRNLTLILCLSKSKYSVPSPPCICS